jgi:multicomponent Na+:H+ antiporter subunit D
LLVAIPLLGAAVVAGTDHVTPQVVQKALAILVAAATVALALLLMTATESAEVVHWFSGWRPRGGVAIGVDFAVGPLAAGMCAVIAAVVLLALVYSWTYMREAARLYDTLMLVALGAMCGFAMSGDLFNMFVWLELVGVAGYALTGFKVDQLGPIQGAVNFAIVNTLGGYFVAIGIALVYAETGALNLAQIGRTLTAQRAGAPAIVALTVILCGFLVKAAVVPFHLWAADAYAVAPAPVCAMFGGVMTDIGLIGVARIYWTAFEGPFAAHARVVGDTLLWMGIVTALLAGTMAFLQRHLKRMLAYSVVCHIGIMLAGIGLLSSKGLAGTAVLFVAYAFLTVSLFLVIGALLATHHTIDELRLHGRGRRDRALGVVWIVAALGLVGVPYLGAYLGHGLIDEGAAALGRHWVQPLLWLGSALAGAALLRAGARIFLGWGDENDTLFGPRLEEEPVERNLFRPLLTGVAVAAVVLGIVVPLVPGIEQRAEHGADRFRDRAAYAAIVLRAKPVETTPRLPYTVAPSTLETGLYAGGATLLALAIAALGLWRQRLPRPLRARSERVLLPPLTALRALHSGVVGEYLLWLVLGTGVLGGVFALTLR